VRSEFLSPVAVIITVFWNVTPCSLADLTDVSMECTVSIFRVDDGGRMLLIKACESLPD
jgi:hypothetical protein